MNWSSGQPNVCCTRPGLRSGRIDLPQFLEADAEFLRLAPRGKAEFGDQLLAERAARAFGEERVFAAQLHAAGKTRLAVAVAGDSHVAGGDADDLAVVAEQHFGRGKARIDLDAQGLRAAPRASA